jgi:hypothetical protein
VTTLAALESSHTIRVTIDEVKSEYVEADLKLDQREQKMKI